MALKLKLEEIETQRRRQRFRECLSNRQAEQVGAIMTTTANRLFRRKKEDRRPCRKVPLACHLIHRMILPQVGGLMSYGVDFDDLFRKAAHYVDKILKGAKPADLPVQQATKFEFVINLKAAKQIGLTLSPEFLSRANKVIK